MHKHVHEVQFTSSSGPRFIARVAMNTLGLWIAARLSTNIEYGDDLLVILVAALIFSIVNVVIRPIVIILALPAIVLTLGLFMLVVNGFMIWLVSQLYGPFEVKTFGAAILGAIIVWIVNYALSMIFVEQSSRIGSSKRGSK